LRHIPQRICLAAEIVMVGLIAAGHPRAPDAGSCVGAGGTGGLEGLVICCRVTAVSGGPSIANTGARPPVAVKVADPPTVPAADTVKLTG
jgi:hypothetical protein